MSRTDKHLPYQIQQADPTWAQVQWTRWGCGCKRCTGQLDRKLNQRRRRAAQRAILAELVKCKADQWDVDFHIPTIDKWISFGSRYGKNVLGKGPQDASSGDPDPR